MSWIVNVADKKAGKRGGNAYRKDLTSREASRARGYRRASAGTGGSQRRFGSFYSEHGQASLLAVVSVLLVITLIPIALTTQAGNQPAITQVANVMTNEAISAAHAGITDYLDYLQNNPLYPDWFCSSEYCGSSKKADPSNPGFKNYLPSVSCPSTRPDCWEQIPGASGASSGVASWYQYVVNSSAVINDSTWQTAPKAEPVTLHVTGCAGPVNPPDGQTFCSSSSSSYAVRSLTFTFDAKLASTSTSNVDLFPFTPNTTLLNPATGMPYCPSASGCTLGTMQFITVPKGMTSMTIELSGGAGAWGDNGLNSGGRYEVGGSPGLGGEVQAILPVQAGQTYAVEVGGSGGGCGTIGSGQPIGPTGGGVVVPVGGRNGEVMQWGGDGGNDGFAQSQYYTSPSSSECAAGVLAGGGGGGVTAIWGCPAGSTVFSACWPVAAAGGGGGGAGGGGNSSGSNGGNGGNADGGGSQVSSEMPVPVHESCPYFTAPSNGTVTAVVYGGAGGPDSQGNSMGGAGAIVKSTFNVSAGDSIWCSSYWAGGGGGGGPSGDGTGGTGGTGGNAGAVGCTGAGCPSPVPIVAGGGGGTGGTGSVNGANCGGNASYGPVSPGGPNPGPPYSGAGCNGSNGNGASNSAGGGNPAAESGINNDGGECPYPSPSTVGGTGANNGRCEAYGGSGGIGGSPGNAGAGGAGGSGGGGWNGSGGWGNTNAGGGAGGGAAGYMKGAGGSAGGGGGGGGGYQGGSGGGGGDGYWNTSAGGGGGGSSYCVGTPGNNCTNAGANTTPGNGGVTSLIFTPTVPSTSLDYGGYCNPPSNTEMFQESASGTISCVAIPAADEYLMGYNQFGANGQAGTPDVTSGTVGSSGGLGSGSFWAVDDNGTAGGSWPLGSYNGGGGGGGGAGFGGYGGPDAGKGGSANTATSPGYAGGGGGGGASWVTGSAADVSLLASGYVGPGQAVVEFSSNPGPFPPGSIWPPVQAPGSGSSASTLQAGTEYYLAPSSTTSVPENCPSFTAPSNGTVKATVYGGAGYGESQSGNNNSPGGGTGAIVTGSFSVAAGDVIACNDAWASGGGGGNPNGDSSGNWGGNGGNAGAVSCTGAGCQSPVPIVAGGGGGEGGSGSADVQHCGGNAGYGPGGGTPGCNAWGGNGASNPASGGNPAGNTGANNTGGIGGNYCYYNGYAGGNGANNGDCNAYGGSGGVGGQPGNSGQNQQWGNCGWGGGWGGGGGGQAGCMQGAGGSAGGGGGGGGGYQGGSGGGGGDGYWNTSGAGGGGGSSYCVNGCTNAGSNRDPGNGGVTSMYFTSSSAAGTIATPSWADGLTVLVAGGEGGYGGSNVSTGSWLDEGGAGGSGGAVVASSFSLSSGAVSINLGGMGGVPTQWSGSSATAACASNAGGSGGAYTSDIGGIGGAGGSSWSGQCGGGGGGDLSLATIGSNVLAGAAGGGGGGGSAGYNLEGGAGGSGGGIAGAVAANEGVFGSLGYFGNPGWSGADASPYTGGGGGGPIGGVGGDDGAWPGVGPSGGNAHAGGPGGGQGDDDTYIGGGGGGGGAGFAGGGGGGSTNNYQGGRGGGAGSSWTNRSASGSSNVLFGAVAGNVQDSGVQTSLCPLNEPQPSYYDGSAGCGGESGYNAPGGPGGSTYYMTDGNGYAVVMWWNTALPSPAAASSGTQLILSNEVTETGL